MVTSWSKAGPLMLKLWTSLLMTSGRNPAASIASAVRKPNDPPP